MPEPAFQDHFLAFSAIMTVAALGWPLIAVGLIEPSMTRNPVLPRTWLAAKYHVIKLGGEYRDLIT
jgi:hypothetical protein